MYMIANKYKRVLFQSVVAYGLLVSGSGFAQDAESPPINKDEILKGIYTRAQASRGESTYKTICQNCHATREHKGLLQQTENSKVQISAYFDLISQTMPQDAPGSLSTEVYLNLIAYLLSLNGFPAMDADDVNRP